jgi:hypothetical protein
MNEKDRARLVAEQTLAFVDEQFGQLDLSGSPDFTQIPKEGFGTDKHGLNVVVESGSNKLRELAENPDTETLERIAQETGNPDLIETLTDERELAEANKFMASHPSYYRDDSNYEQIREWLHDHNLPFIAENIATAFKALCRQGKMEMRPGTAKTLENHELLHIIALCKEGKLDEAISLYLTYALPGAERIWSDTTDFIQDERTLNVRNAACRFVFLNGYNAQDSPAFRSFEKSYFHKRSPIRTVNDYVVMAEEFAKQEQAVERERIVFGPDQPQTVTRSGIENLSDEQIATLTKNTLRQRAQERGRRGVLV